jgi:hypothetical protein
MVNDCDLYSQSNSVDYYQFSSVILRGESINEDSELYVFGEVKSSLKTSSPILFTCLKFQDIYSFQIRVLVKTRALLYQEVSSITSQSIFINEVVTSINLYKSLYIV